MAPALSLLYLSYLSGVPDKTFTVSVIFCNIWDKQQNLLFSLRRRTKQTQLDQFFIVCHSECLFISAFALYSYHSCITFGRSLALLLPFAIS